MDRLQQVIEIIQQAKSWKQQDGVYRVHSNRLTIGDSPSILNGDDLSLVDTRLPIVLPEFLDNLKRLNHPNPGMWVRMLLNVWRNGYVLPDTNSDKHGVYNLHKVEVVDDFGIANIHGSVFGLSEFKHAHADFAEPILYPSSYIGTVLSVPTSYLDKEYPHWMARWEASLALGLNDTEAAKKLFESPRQLAAVSLPTFTF